MSIICVSEMHKKGIQSNMNRSGIVGLKRKYTFGFNFMKNFQDSINKENTARIF